MTRFSPGDRVYNLRPFFGKPILALPRKEREQKRKGVVMRINDDGWPWVLWDDGYECGVSPSATKLQHWTVIDELAELGRTAP